MGTILFQMKSLLKKKEFYIGISIYLFYVLLNYFSYVKKMYGFGTSGLMGAYEYDALSSWSEYEWYYNQFFVFVVIIPAGFAFFQDFYSGNNILMEYRMGRLRYFYTKCIAIILVGMLAFVIPFLFGLLLDWITFPQQYGHYPDYSTYYSSYYLNYAHSVTNSDFYLNHPWCYHILMTLGIGFFAGVVSLFTSLFLFFGFKFRILYFLPFYVVNYLLSVLAQRTGIEGLDLYWYTMLEAVASYKIPYFLGMLTVVLLLLCYFMSKYAIRNYPVGKM